MGIQGDAEVDSTRGAHATRKVGIAKQISPHSLRHTFAIRALRFSGNAVTVSKLLGHASVATTQVYLNHLGLGELRAAVPHLPTHVDRFL